MYHCRLVPSEVDVLYRLTFHELTMEQLSSCYFCGAALDASLDEYPVIPKELHPTPDDQKTVVLCQGCRQKLGTVVETIVSVVENPESGGTGDGRARGAAEQTAGEDALADEGWVDASELSSSGDADDAPTTRANADDEPADDAGADDGSEEVTYTTSTAAGGRKSVSGNPESIRDDGRATGGNDGGAAATDDGETASNDAAGDVDGGSEAADDGRPSLSALENTKVMRLLQNREFPVDREEIRTVAVNAYDLDESQFDAVVDAAVDRGLIGEENGQFVEAN